MGCLETPHCSRSNSVDNGPVTPRGCFLDKDRVAVGDQDVTYGFWRPDTIPAMQGV